MKMSLFTLIFVFAQIIAWGQFSYLEGRVLDEKKEPIQDVEVMFFKSNELSFNTKTDLQGHYKFSLSPGDYDLFFQHEDYHSTTYLNVKVWEGKTNQISITLEKCEGISCASVYKAKEMLYNPYDLTSNSCFSADQIRRLY